MIQSNLLPKVLEQVNTDGIQLSILLNFDGSILSYVGNKDKTTISAIVSSIMSSYEKLGKNMNDKLSSILIEMENGKLISTKISDKVILCLYGDKSIEFGILKLKSEILSKYFEKPFHQVDYE